MTDNNVVGRTDQRAASHDRADQATNTANKPHMTINGGWRKLWLIVGLLALLGRVKDAAAAVISVVIPFLITLYDRAKEYILGASDAS